MRYLSLFSGIEAASVAWKPLGWQCAGVAEVEPFPCAVLAHHFPDVPNIGDVTKVTHEQVTALGPVDLVVGGFPCQDLSVAGKRKGLQNDDGSSTRSGLFYDGLRIANWSGAKWVVVENVPGLFSSNSGRDFAAVVGALAGCEFDVPGDGWRNAGVVVGPLGLVEWITLDAQFVRVESHPRAVPQRRRRVFIVRHSGDWRSRPPLFLERASLQGHPAPRREAREGITGSLTARTRGGGGLGTDFDCDGGLIPARSMCLNAGAMGRIDSETETLIPTIGGGFDVAHSLRADGFDASEDGTGRGTPLIPIGIDGGQVGFALRAGASHSGDKGDGVGMNTTPAIAFDARQSDVIQYGDKAGPLDTDGYTMAVAFDMRGRDGGAQLEGPHETANIRAADGGSSRSYVAFAQNQRDELRLMDVSGALASEPGMKQQTYMQSGMQVRRLTPLECERLQGFPDGWTDIPYRGKKAADGSRYKSLGNSMACNVMSFIGRRIAMVNELLREAA